MSAASSAASGSSAASASSASSAASPVTGGDPGVEGPDVLGSRMKLAVLIPSTNTVVEPEYNAMAAPGVTIHSGRLMITDPDTGSNAAFERLMGQVAAALPDTVASLATCKPTRIALGMTAVAFLGGREGESGLIARLQDMAGVPVTSGPESIGAALELYGARRVAVLSPYQPVAEDHVARYFDELGVEIVRSASLRSPSATSIAKVSEAETIGLVEGIDGDDVDAIVQLGTNLAMVGLLDQLETRLGKPVLAINSATIWRAMRAEGIDDPVEGFGALMRDH